MTSYFDDKATALRTLRQTEIVEGEPYIDRMEALREIEETLVRDVVICAEWPGLPATFRDAIHKAVFRCGHFTRPYRLPNPRVDDDPDVFELIETMVSDLHTIFHGIGTWARGDDPAMAPFTDSPRSPITWLVGKGQEYREDVLVPAMQSAKDGA